jgi:hypothetical protein
MSTTSGIDMSFTFSVIARKTSIGSIGSKSGGATVSEQNCR